MQDFEKLGLFYLGREYDLGGAETGRPAGSLRLARPRDPCRVRRNDRERQDGSVHRADRRSRDRWRPCDCDRSEGGPSATSFSLFRDLAPKTSVRGSTRKKPGVPARRADAFAAQQAQAWKAGLAEWGQDGARIERLRAAAEFADLHAWQQRGTAGVGAQLIRRSSAGGTRRCGAHGGPRRGDRHERSVSGGCVCRAAQPRALAARPRSSRPRGRRDATSISRPSSSRSRPRRSKRSGSSTSNPSSPRRTASISH